MAKRGFSLIELSIVLVILGLLVGGILAGRSLIRASELRSVTTEFNRYNTAFLAFRDKYFALPGDFANATSIWGTDPGGCPGTSATTTGPGSATCNGNGDGMINGLTANDLYRSWQHLADAGLIEGQYTGVPNSTSWWIRSINIAMPNVPVSRLSGAAWNVQFVGGQDITSTYFFDGSYPHILLLGIAAGDPLASAGPLSPEDAWNIDTKMDDGKPGSGRVLSLKNSNQANAANGCSNQTYTIASSIAATSDYLLTNSKSICALAFKMNF